MILLIFNHPQKLQAPRKKNVLYQRIANHDFTSLVGARLGNPRTIMQYAIYNYASCQTLLPLREDEDLCSCKSHVSYHRTSTESETVSPSPILTVSTNSHIGKAGAECQTRKITRTAPEISHESETQSEETYLQLKCLINIPDVYSTVQYHASRRIAQDIGLHNIILHKIVRRAMGYMAKTSQPTVQYGGYGETRQSGSDQNGRNNIDDYYHDDMEFYDCCLVVGPLNLHTPCPFQEKKHFSQPIRKLIDMGGLDHHQKGGDCRPASSHAIDIIERIYGIDSPHLYLAIALFEAHIIMVAVRSRASSCLSDERLIASLSHNLLHSAFFTFLRFEARTRMLQIDVVLAPHFVKSLATIAAAAVTFRIVSRLSNSSFDPDSCICLQPMIDLHLLISQTHTLLDALLSRGKADRTDANKDSRSSDPCLDHERLYCIQYQNPRRITRNADVSRYFRQIHVGECNQTEGMLGINERSAINDSKPSNNFLGKEPDCHCVDAPQSWQTKRELMLELQGFLRHGYLKCRLRDLEGCKCIALSPMQEVDGKGHHVLDPLPELMSLCGLERIYKFRGVGRIAGLHGDFGPSNLTDSDRDQVISPGAVDQYGFVNSTEHTMMQQDQSGYGWSLSAKVGQLDVLPCILNCWMGVRANKEADHGLALRLAYAPSLKRQAYWGSESADASTQGLEPPTGSRRETVEGRDERTPGPRRYVPFQTQRLLMRGWALGRCFATQHMMRSTWWRRRTLRWRLQDTSPDFDPRRRKAKGDGKKSLTFVSRRTVQADVRLLVGLDLLNSLAASSDT
ncbi:uncharacterized protein MYCFIDRAFT_173197 [Pseudocercospora fijiensis CIRAD86]|uniref:Uncharacterized protein n=1 Tax=Pseudocercospora fijiensis (strain CIRAD86) TaxID=383855 RepID=M2Z2S9_PSEFD|nr:uncharacterized protein MYCFIDRAFT_173197 [Pseudocercospora fijiensis CIRAD86]EME84155.1 hypothetical protein MYCFIDRAFT_173197 [Pseudocercospora fijiensis CIRAD86]